MKSGLVAILSSLFLLATAAAGAPRETVFPDDRTLGSPDAPVVVIEYLAPVCPHCAHFAATVFPQIKSTYIDTGKVRYVIRIFPISAVDGAVAGMAKCMPPGRYYEFLDLAFKNQPMWDPDGNEIPDQQAALVKLGGMGGLNPEEAARCMKDLPEFARVNRIAQDGVERYHIEAVPSLVIDGKVLTGGASWPELQARLDEVLARGPQEASPIALPSPRPVLKAKTGKKHAQLQKKKHGKKAHIKKARHKKAKPAHKSVKAKKAKRH